MKGYAMKRIALLISILLVPLLIPSPGLAWFWDPKPANDTKIKEEKTSAYAQAKVVVVKEEMVVRKIGREVADVWGLYLIGAIKNVGNQDATDVVIGYDCPECSEKSVEWQNMKRVYTIKYLSAGDKETFEIMACIKYVSPLTPYKPGTPINPVTAKIISFK